MVLSNGNCWPKRLFFAVCQMPESLRGLSWSCMGTCSQCLVYSKAVVAWAICILTLSCTSRSPWVRRPSLGSQILIAFLPFDTIVTSCTDTAWGNAHKCSCFKTFERVDFQDLIRINFRARADFINLTKEEPIYKKLHLRNRTWLRKRECLFTLCGPDQSTFYVLVQINVKGCCNCYGHWITFILSFTVAVYHRLLISCIS
jgi:hypothetical protein